MHEDDDLDHTQKQEKMLEDLLDPDPDLKDLGILVEEEPVIQTKDEENKLEDLEIPL